MIKDKNFCIWRYKIIAQLEVKQIFISQHISLSLLSMNKNEKKSFAIGKLWIGPQKSRLTFGRSVLFWEIGLIFED